MSGVTTTVHKIEGIRITQKRFSQDGADRGFWVTSVEVEGSGDTAHTFKFFSSKQLPVTLGEASVSKELNSGAQVTAETVHFIQEFATEIQEEE